MMSETGSVEVLTFGNFLQELPESGEYLTIVFSPSSLPLQKRWENNGLSADFIADYFKFFYTSKRFGQTGVLPDSSNEEFAFSLDNLRDTVKYVANELLENAMKFQDKRVPCTARMLLYLYEDNLVFCVEHGIGAKQAAQFQTYIKRLLDADPDSLYFEAMRNSAKEENAEQSGLGLLSMMCDYGAQLGWKFETQSNTNPILTKVTTMVVLRTHD